MSTLKPCHFRLVLFCLLYIRVHVIVVQQQHVSHKYEHQLVLFLTCPYYSKTTKILREHIHHTWYFIFYYMVYAGLRMILAAGLRNWLDISVRVELNLAFVWGIKICLVLVWGSIDLFFVLVVEIELVFVCGPEITWFLGGWSKSTCFQCGGRKLTWLQRCWRLEINEEVSCWKLPLVGCHKDKMEKEEKRRSEEKERCAREQLSSIN